MTPYEILTKAQDLIRDPKHWTQGEEARGQDGYEMSPYHKSAYCFCSIGAMRRAVGRDAHPRCVSSFKSAVITLRGVTGLIGDFNDSHTHAEVMAAFDRARELASQEKHA